MENKELKDRKIGWHDWVYIRKWHISCSLLGVGFMGVAIGSGFAKDYGACILSAILSGLLLIISLVFMAKDKELNEKNGVKRFWLNF
jgi:uncharacterized membrane protein YfcA